MKVLFSQIKELVPDLTVEPREVGEVLTYAGFMMESFEEVDYKGKKDFLIGLEIRQNRADCLSVIGIAREVAAYYKLPTVIPELPKINYVENKIDVDVLSTEYIRRVLAVKINNVKNGESPTWLKKFVNFYNMNSVNFLVDLSNYVMIFTGYPSHLLDMDRVSGKISWSINNKFDKITTLLGTDVELKRNNELVIHDEKNVLALAGLVGGDKAEIGVDSKNIFVEIAVYDRSIVRKNSRSLNIVTEASHRLEKDIDPNESAYAMDLLVGLIIEHAGGSIESNLYDYYQNKREITPIKFNLSLPSVIAGIEISHKDVLGILRNLDFKVEKIDKLTVSVTPPSYRMDVSMKEDLVEEVIRVYDYRKIPSKILPKLEVVKNITPKNIIVADKIRDYTASLGFDEILSWPLTRAEENTNAKYSDWNIVSTQNSVNEHYPELRSSMSIGLFNQFKEYNKKNVEIIEIFEIGKIFGEKDNEYLEQEMIGFLYTSLESEVNTFKNRIEKILRYSGFSDVKFVESENKPLDANLNSCWNIYVNNNSIGILYKYRPQEEMFNIYFSELNITLITLMLQEIENNPVVEITQKLISLDANIELDKEDRVDNYVTDIKSKIKQENIWSISVADIYKTTNKIRYTIRVVYKNLSDQDAKKIHLKAFNL